MIMSVPLRRRENGLVLLDVLMVTVILAILAVIAVPQLDSLIGDSKLNGSANEMVSGLRYACSLAVKYQRPFGLTANTTANSFSVFDTAVPATGDPPVNAANIVLNPIDKAWYVKNFSQIDAYQGVKIVTAPVGGAVLFYPDGHTGAADSVFSVAYAARQKTITVSGVTGLVTVQ
jgi:Tfp pilus assembly protein FimT